jgi:hypothetical protein
MGRARRMIRAWQSRRYPPCILLPPNLYFYLGRPPDPRVENGHTASCSQGSFLAALRRLTSQLAQGVPPPPRCPSCRCGVTTPCCRGPCRMSRGPCGPCSVRSRRRFPFCALPASRPSDGSLGGSVALHLCRPMCMPHHVQSPLEHCCSPRPSTVFLSAAEVMVQSFVGLFRCLPSAAGPAGFLYSVWAFCPPPRFLSWLVLPHPVGTYHPWALVLLLSGFAVPLLGGRGSCTFVVSRSPHLEPFEALDAVGASVLFHKLSRWLPFHVAFFRIVGV